MMPMDRLILGSQSPRRKDILSFFKIPFKQASSDFEDLNEIVHEDPFTYAAFLSEGKAFSLQPQFQDEIILTADSLVYCDDTIFEKPKTPEHGYTMLQQLGGKKHSVITAVSVLKKTQCYTLCEETKVELHPIDERQAKLYFHACGGLDKAGGFSIEQAGSLIIKKIDGCFYNVVGLPINAVATLLQKVGIDLWHFLS